MFANRFNLFLIFTIIIIKQIQCIPTKKSDLIIDEHHRIVRSIENLNDKDNKLNGKSDDDSDDDDDDDNDDDKEKHGKLNQAQKFQRQRHKQLELLSD